MLPYPFLKNMDPDVFGIVGLPAPPGLLAFSAWTCLTGRKELLCLEALRALQEEQ